MPFQEPAVTVASDDLVEEATEVLRLARETPRQAIERGHRPLLTGPPGRVARLPTNQLHCELWAWLLAGFIKCPKLWGTCGGRQRGRGHLRRQPGGRSASSAAGAPTLAGATNEAMTTLDGTRAAGETAVLVALPSGPWPSACWVVTRRRARC